MSARPPELAIPAWLLRLGAIPGARLPLPETRLLAMFAGSASDADVARAVRYWRGRGADGVVSLSGGTRLVVAHRVARTVLRHPDAGNARELVGDPPDRGPYDRLLRNSIAYVDGPDHQRLRRLVGPHLERPAALDRADAMRSTVRSHLAGIDRPVGRRLDLAGAVVAPMVEALVGELCGVPEGDRPRVAAWLAAAETRWRRTPFVGRRVQRGADDGLGAFDRWLAQAFAAGRLGKGVFVDLCREREAGGEGVGADAHADFANSLVGTAFFVYGAARVTVERFLVTSLTTLGGPVGESLGVGLGGSTGSGAPPSVTPELTEELLRWDPPAAVAARVTRAPLTVGDHELPEGTQLIVLMRVVNRDPEVFEDADRFVATRKPNPHLSFSAGAHYCLGAPLARVEGPLVLEEILRWLGPYRVVKAPVQQFGLPHRPVSRLVVTAR